MKERGFTLVLNRVKDIDWGGLVWHWLPLLAYASAIFFVSSLSDPKQDVADFLHAVNPLIPGEKSMFYVFSDMFYHVAEYTVLAVLVYRAFRYSWKNQSEISLGLLTFMAVILFGCTDELYQWFTPFRHSGVEDVVADAFGGILGMYLWEAALSISVIRLLEEQIPLKLRVALGNPVLKM